MANNIVRCAHLILRSNKLASAKAFQLYGNANLQRWEKDGIYDEQFQTVWRLAYKELSDNHKKTKWLQNLDDRPEYLSKLEYIAARGGKDIMIELCNILVGLGGIELNYIPLERNSPSFDKPETPLDIYEKEIV